jgi:trans-2,3-dihydro-3-hydroxyanthranilate isomerase
MPSYAFMQVDAFTDRPLGGNPCAIVFDADEIDAGTRLAIAREMNLSETSFVVTPAAADFAARYFTPAEEIPLAGHPTIATVFALVAAGRLALSGDHTVISLELLHGPIRVEIFAKNGRVERIVMSQRKPQFLSLHDPAKALALFNLQSGDLLPGAMVQTVSTGTPQLFLPLRSLDALRRARLDVAAYEAYRARSDFFSPHLFCLHGATPAGQTFARHFGTPPDLMEDPFTGSATGGMGAYLWRYGLIDQPAFTAEQGHWMGRPGTGSVEIIGPRDDIETVKVGGGAVLVLQGELLL